MSEDLIPIVELDLEQGRKAEFLSLHTGTRLSWEAIKEVRATLDQNPTAHLGFLKDTLVSVRLLHGVRLRRYLCRRSAALWCACSRARATSIENPRPASAAQPEQHTAPHCFRKRPFSTVCYGARVRCDACQAEVNRESLEYTPEGQALCRPCRGAYLSKVAAQDALASGVYRRCTCGAVLPPEGDPSATPYSDGNSGDLDLATSFKAICTSVRRAARASRCSMS